MKQSQELREELEQKTDDELQNLVEELDGKIEDRKPISNKMLNRCRKKAVASSILDDRNPSNSSTATSSNRGSKTRGQQGLDAFSQRATTGENH